MSSGNTESNPAGGADLTERTEQFVRFLGQAQIRVYAFILSLVHDENEADEIFQETNLVLWRKFAEFDPATNFIHWACRVAYLAVQKRRELSAKAKEVLLTGELLTTVVQESIDETELFESKRQALAQCVERLRADDRVLLQLRYISGASPASLAKQVGRSASAVYKALNRIHWQLLECVRRKLIAESRS